MQPRTIGILIAALVVASFGVRIVVEQTGILPVTEQAVLKQASAITIGYTLVTPGKDGKQVLVTKSLPIREPEQLAELLAVLHLRRSHAPEGRKFQQVIAGNPPTVTFHFPDGSARPMMPFSSREFLGDMIVNRQFYERLQEHVSRVEGRPIELLQDAGPGVPVGPGAPWEKEKW